MIFKISTTGQYNTLSASWPSIQHSVW